MPSLKEEEAKEEEEKRTVFEQRYSCRMQHTEWQLREKEAVL